MTIMAVILAACVASIPAAQDFSWGGSIRGYQFLKLEDDPFGQRRDTELWSLRLTAISSPAAGIKFENHAVLELLSPSFAAVSRLAAGSITPYLPLQHAFLENEDLYLHGYFDRLNLQFELRKARIILGRQAVTWGVSYFWPTMDLFAPFAPQRVDRDYKPGVDAVRATIPVGSFSEIDIIGASLGPSPSKDWAGAMLSRINLGRVDIGLMGGKFHRDTVAGAFFTSSLKGTVLRGELTWTNSGDPADEERNRQRFTRGALGADRQLTPEFNLTVEFAWNGYGTSDAAQYVQWVPADRIRRGEINALGRVYLAAASGWQLHPLWHLYNVLLINANDPSVLWVPSLRWSTGNNAEVLFGAQVGIGEGIKANEILGSEYGSMPATIFAGFKIYF